MLRKGDITNSNTYIRKSYSCKIYRQICKTELFCVLKDKKCLESEI